MKNTYTFFKSIGGFNCTDRRFRESVKSTRHNEIVGFFVPACNEIKWISLSFKDNYMEHQFSYKVAFLCNRNSMICLPLDNTLFFPLGKGPNCHLRYLHILSIVLVVPPCHWRLHIPTCYHQARAKWHLRVLECPLRIEEKNLLNAGFIYLNRRKIYCF